MHPARLGEHGVGPGGDRHGGERDDDPGQDRGGALVVEHPGLAGQEQHIALGVDAAGRPRDALVVEAEHGGVDLGPEPAIATEAPSSDPPRAAPAAARAPSAVRWAARPSDHSAVGPGVGDPEGGEVLLVEAEAGIGGPAAGRHQLLGLVHEAGHGGVDVVALGVDAGGRPAHADAEAGEAVGGGAGQQLGAVDEDLARQSGDAHGRDVGEVEDDEGVGRTRSCGTSRGESGTHPGTRDGVGGGVGGRR